jgi:hypothetical protein
MRKPVEDLNVADLEEIPVWVFGADDGGEDEDETWVQPLPNGSLPESGEVLCVAAAARLACGVVYPAVVFGPMLEGMDVNAVALLTTEGRILFCRGDSPKEVRQSLLRLGLGRNQVFPLEYAMRAQTATSGADGVGVFSP